MVSATLEKTNIKRGARLVSAVKCRPVRQYLNKRFLGTSLPGFNTTTVIWRIRGG